MSDFWLYAIIIAVLFIAGLAYYAGKLLMQLKTQTQQQNQAQLAQQEALNEHDKKVLISVVIIVRAMKEEQCDFSEGCWRLAVLLLSLKASQELDAEFPAIFNLYEQIKHLSILEERKKLTKQQRMKEDLQRMQAETEFHTQIHQDLERLSQYANERITMLTN